MVYPNSGSTLTNKNGTNKTSTSLSTNILIEVNGVAVGAIQDIDWTEIRSLKMIDEVGTDGHIDSAPNGSVSVTGSCNRIRFDRLRIAPAFSRGFIHVSSQIYPFDITIHDNSKSDTNSQVTTIIKNVWIKDIKTTYKASDWIISETMTFEAETIFSIMNNGPVANASERSDVVPSIIPVEQSTDTGSRRGSLDASGLIDIGSSGTVY